MTIAITEYGRIREFASCGAVIVRKVGEYFFFVQQTERCNTLNDLEPPF